MKPAEIHAMQTKDKEQFTDGHLIVDIDLARELFGFESMNIEWPENPELEIAVKAERYEGGFGNIVLRSISYEGRPFAINAQNGKTSTCYLTDEAVFAEAMAYVRGLVQNEDTALKTVDAEADLDLGEALSGSALGRIGDELRMMPAKLVSADGNALLDLNAWRVACGDKVVPGIKELGDVTFRDERVRALAADAFRAAQIPGVDYVEIMDFDDEEIADQEHWIAFLAATEEGTYVIGVGKRYHDSRNWPWTHDLVSERVGGPEVIMEFRSSSFVM